DNNNENDRQPPEGGAKHKKYDLENDPNSEKKSQPDQVGQTSRKDGPVIIPLSNVKPEPIKWLWPNHLAAGKLTLFVGDPAVGKSTAAIDFVCRISTGVEWPDGVKAPLGNAILLISEDNLADTVRPRLDAHNGDSSCIHALTAIRAGEKERPF